MSGTVTIPANLASITAGAVHGSEWVTVSCDEDDGSTIEIYRGLFLIGSALLASGSAVVGVAPLATGDVIQASVTQRGNQCGLPVMVTASSAKSTGWVIPQTVEITGPDGEATTLTADEYFELYGEYPAAVYDPARLISVVGPDPEVITVASSSQILFDVRIEQAVGVTTVTVQNVINQSGLALARWAAGESFGNVLSRNYTAGATITLDVRGEDDTVFATKVISVSVFSPPTSSAVSSDIKAYSYRLMGSGDFVRLLVNSLKPCECRLEGFDMSWQTMIFYGYGPDYQEGSFAPVPAGTYTLWARVAGDTDASHWKSLVITLT